MEQASKYTLIMENGEEGTCDTNILSLPFSSMKFWKNLQSPLKPIPCESCYSVLNSSTKIYSRQQILEYSPDSVPIKPKLISSYHIDEINKKPKKKSKKPIILDSSEEEGKNEGQEGTPRKIPSKHRKIQEKFEVENLRNEVDSYWVCDFCGHINEIENASNSFQPKDPEVFYALNQIQPSNINVNDDISVIFCLDNSGSMSSSIEIPANMSAQYENENINKEELEMLKAVLSPVEYEAQLQAMRSPGMKSHVTRKNCLIKAIQKELNKMKEESPNRKIGIVVFSDDVLVAGDGRYSPQFLSGGDLLNYDKCLEVGKASQNLMTQYVSQNFQTVINTYKDNPEKGKTALGPALVASVGLASTGKPGSMVILCTDGLANVGFGDLTIGDNVEIGIYDKVSDLADESGVMINIMTIMGEQTSKLAILGKMAEKTNGNIERVNPSVINHEIRAMLNENIIGRKVFVTMYLPSFLRFVGEDARTLSEGGSVCRKDMGNITETTKVSFKFAVKGYVFKRKKKILKENKKILFQAQIKYLSLEGTEVLRVISSEFAITLDEEKALLNGNIGVIVNYAAYEIADLMTEKREGEMIERQNKWNILMEKIRDMKRDHDRLNAQDDMSIKSFKADGRIAEEMTMRMRKNRPIKRNAGNNDNNDESDDNDEATVIAMRMKKRNYNR